MAVGDGPNDILMLKESNIGVSIGTDKSRFTRGTSDIWLPRFSGLSKLLLVHGGLSYLRISEMILYFFYKSVTFTGPQIGFMFVSAYSGQPVYEDWYVSFYSIAFTSLPLIVRAIFDYDLRYYKWKSTVLNKGTPMAEGTKVLHTLHNLKQYYPYLYYIGQENRIFTWKNVVSHLVQALVMGICIFGLIYNRGNMPDFWFMSLTMYTSIIFIVYSRLMVTIRAYTWLHILILGGSIGISMVGIIMGDHNPIFKSQWSIEQTVSSYVFWLVVFLCSVIAILYDTVITLFLREFYPSVATLFQSIVRRKREHEGQLFQKLVLQDQHKKLMSANGGQAPKQS